jgi:hypothetical protein
MRSFASVLSFRQCARIGESESESKGKQCSRDPSIRAQRNLFAPANSEITLHLFAPAKSQRNLFAPANSEIWMPTNAPKP